MCQGVGNVRDGNDLGRHMAGRGVDADGLPDPLLQFVGQLPSRLHLDEEDDADVVLPVLSHHDAVDNSVDRVHLTVDFRRTDADAAGVECGVGTAVHDDAAPLGDEDVIAVTPDVRIDLEIGGPIFFVPWIIPEIDGHGGGGRRTDQFSLPVDDGFAVFIEGLDLHAEAAALQFRRSRPAPWDCLRQNNR